MSGLSIARAVTLGVVGSLIMGETGWRAFLLSALLILSALMTDWIAEDAADKRDKAFAARLAGRLRGQR